MLRTFFACALTCALTVGAASTPVRADDSAVPIVTVVNEGGYVLWKLLITTDGQNWVDLVSANGGQQIQPGQTAKLAFRDRQTGRVLACDGITFIRILRPRLPPRLRLAIGSSVP
jgi:hypothetical protein